MRRRAVLTTLAAAAGLPVRPQPQPVGLQLRYKHLGDAAQAIIVSGESWTSTYATLRSFQRDSDGRWQVAYPAMPARTGYGGWAWAAKRVQDRGLTPAGTFTLTEGFGVQANPGSRLPYRKVDGDDYWAGDKLDPATYNIFQPSAPTTRTWRITESERLADYPTQYAYAAVIDFNRPAGVHWDASHGQNVTATPSHVGAGSAVFLHCSGAGNTAGCVSVGKDDMVTLLKWLDPARHPRIVMAPAADLHSA
ncbi:MULTISPECIES: L,D-transpeptidase family protein [unclassified Actinoplanes]|uniref:L,D-transpeptidase family protein n=1 Tax=unclassified Actinoplanes TaxID=2626549 RepID=UPI0009C1D601|nr:MULTISPECIES: L,D-transpeptidase family protein [unclassified Actinoplanes]SLM01176.1 hypothetical protein ACSP50_4409 [Actinoplanes sp. SE50/110]